MWQTVAKRVLAGPTRSHRRSYEHRACRQAAPESALIFTFDANQVPLPTSDPALLEILKRHADHLLAKLPPSDDFIARVRQLIAQELTGGDPSADHLATRLGMSSRTLRRRLEERGTGHKALLDEIRRELAMRHLGEERLEIGEVAFLLGYSEASAFHRAFKRWTGSTPVDYREHGV